MTRFSIALAVATGIAPDVWIGQGWRTMVTAAELLDVRQDRGRAIDGG